MQMMIEYKTLRDWKRTTVKAVAPVIAILILFLFLVGPMYLFRVFMGIPLDGKGPSDELWLMVLGIGLGNSAAYFGFSAFLSKFGGFTTGQIDAMWREEES